MFALFIPPAFLSLHTSIRSVFLHLLREVTYASEDAALLVAGEACQLSYKTIPATGHSMDLASLNNGTCGGRFSNQTSCCSEIVAAAITAVR